MQEFEIQEIMQGEEVDVFWVSVGFESDQNVDDVLHIVCAKAIDEQDIELGHDTIYLERHDQSFSCYGGADFIDIASNKITVQFNAIGSESIGLTGKVIFSSKNSLTEAVNILEEMSKLECGNCVSTA